MNRLSRMHTTFVLVSVAVLTAATCDLFAQQSRTGRPRGDGFSPRDSGPPVSAGDVVLEEAPAGFDNLTNGFLTQEEFDAAREAFEEHEEIDDGVGPVYNARSCAGCHENPVSGGMSQITELRAGHTTGGRHGSFEDAPGGSLINDRAIDAAIQESVPDSENVTTFRLSLNTLGDGFVEAVDDQTFFAIAEEQARRSHGRIRGTIIQVLVLESEGELRAGRFGWKNQHASLPSFAADAYLNEMGITSPLQPLENTSLGRPVADYDEVPDPEDDGDDVEAFADFMRATKAPPRDLELAQTPEAMNGAEMFESIGCTLCHVPTIVTAPVGTVINGGTLVVPPALGDKAFHPYGDFMMHDVGTGDGIVQNGGQETRNMVRTAPLWGVRIRSRLMHDGQSVTLRDAILRHGGEAQRVTASFRRLRAEQQQDLLTFLMSL